ncbi:MAG: hypothetical protein RLZZ292_397 [Bacteroidota bacterium]|jgi:hypothetical protein
MKSLKNLRNEFATTNQIPTNQLINVKGGDDKRDRPGGGDKPKSSTASVGSTGLVYSSSSTTLYNDASETSIW